MIFFLFFLLNNGMLYGRSDSIGITYIANCGFLIKIDSQKIIIDGLFKSGHNRYPTPNASTQKLLEAAQYPFNNINLILVSHTHEDHFDKNMVLNCMLNNSSATLICPQQVIAKLSENDSLYQKIKTRIIECTPDTFTSQFIHIEGVDLHVCRFAHPGERHKNVQNIAYLVSVNGKSVFHSADIDPLQIDKFTGIKLNESNIDVGLINEDFAKIENAALTRKFISAKHNVAMHLPDHVANVWLDSFKDKPGLFLNPFIFSKKMDKKSFFITGGMEKPSMKFMPPTIK
ncbi:MAG: MBL fold metallo-hydrolase [Paludibacter sp.]|nr:MBL fold metallo-hydrolase [Paludibacter sp.]